MCQRSVLRGSPSFRLQLLSVPVMDNTAEVCSNKTYELNRYTPALPLEKMLWYRNHYLPNKKDWSRPEASPLFWEGDWTKLPPAIMVLGELDILRHEGEQFGAKLEEAGVMVDVHILKGQPHPFLAMDGVLKDGQQAITWFCEGMLKAMYR